MIRENILGISLATREARRRFVMGFWLVEAAFLAALFRFPMPPNTHWQHFVPLLATLAIAMNLPLVLGGFSVGGALAFYEGRRWQPGAKTRAQFANDPNKMRRLERFVQAIQPADERETQLRDWAHHRAYRLLFWALYLGAIAFLIVSAVDLTLLARFGFVLLALLLVASMSLPQSLLLWTLPNPEDPQ